MRYISKIRGSGKMAVLFSSLIGGILVSLPAMATIHPGNGSEHKLLFSEATDIELAEMRGRFANGNNIVYFGVEMLTSWTTAQNEHFTGNITLTVGLENNNFVPTITYKVDKPDDIAEVRSDGQVISAGGLDNAEGVVQSIQVAGDVNEVQNTISITIDSTGAVPEFPGGETLESEQYVTEILTSGELALEFDIPGQGHVMQSITNGQGLKQQVQLSSDFNSVINHMNIIAGVSDIQRINMAGVRSALGNINTLRGIGRF